MGKWLAEQLPLLTSKEEVLPTHPAGVWFYLRG